MMKTLSYAKHKKILLNNIKEIQVNNRELLNRNIIFSCAIKLERDNLVKLCL